MGEGNQKVANAGAATPKKLFEVSMIGRMEAIEDVFSTTNMQVACWKIVIRFVLKNVVEMSFATRWRNGIRYSSSYIQSTARVEKHSNKIKNGKCIQ